MKSLEKTLKQIKNLEKGLRQLIEQEIVNLRKLDKNIQAELHPEGFIIYSLGNSDLVTATIHNGTHVPEKTRLRQTETERKKETDLHTGELYLPIFLEQGGIWITSHLSRYFVDLNRPPETAILSYDAPDEKGNLANTKNKRLIIKQAQNYYETFYTATTQQLKKGKFLFSGHSMNQKGQRGDFCLIYKTVQEGQQLKKLLQQQGFENVRINNPFQYKGENFRVFADQFVKGNSVEFETNKRLYLNETTFKKTDKFEEVATKISLAIDDYLRKTLFEFS